MEKGNYIKFLGTAGARYVVAKQLRSSGGVFMELKGKKIILDPGPGTLVRCAASRPKIEAGTLDAIILSHLHIDHTGDVNVLIDAMTEGGLKRRGILFAPDECLNGENAVVLKYLRGFPEEIVTLRESHSYRLGDLAFSTSMKLDHNVETYGIKFDLGDQKLSFIVDTRYFPGLIEEFKDSDVLVLNVVRYPTGDQARSKTINIPHLWIDDAKNILSRIRPKKAILTHFGMTMLRAKPWGVARSVTEETGIEVVAASDGLRIDL